MVAAATASSVRGGDGGWSAATTDGCCGSSPGTAGPTAPIDSCLDPVASPFDATVERIHECHRLDDQDAATVAIAAPLVGGPHRMCEIVTPPLVPQFNHRRE